MTIAASAGCGMPRKSGVSRENAKERRDQVRDLRLSAGRDCNRGLRQAADDEEPAEEAAQDVRRPMRYIDLMGGQKPHLLMAARNNLGAETRVQYAASTKFYVAAQLADELAVFIFSEGAQRL